MMFAGGARPDRCCDALVPADCSVRMSAHCNHRAAGQAKRAGRSKIGSTSGWVTSRPVGYARPRSLKLPMVPVVSLDRRGFAIIGSPPAGRNVTRRTGHTACPEASSSLK
jgi:hypothetical protein